MDAPAPAQASSPAASAPRDVLLPDDAVLLHIGPHKTGTTSIQYAFHVARPRLGDHGVVYAGARRHSVRAAQAVRGIDAAKDPFGVAQWRELVTTARKATTSRVVVSSEWFSEATPAAIPGIVRDLGAERVHVVVTLRPLAAILSSQWQQYVQGGVTVAYDDWLDGVLNGSGRDHTPSFWERHRHDALIARWRDVVGPHRVVAVVADDRDHRFLLTAFERMLGLPADTLSIDPDVSNRSLTWPEVEVVRAINRTLENAGVDLALRRDLVLFGASRAIRERVPGGHEPRIVTPPWALDRGTEIGGEIAAAIQASGVRVIGDLGRLSEAPGSWPASRETEPAAWLEIAAAAAAGVLARVNLVPSLPGVKGAMPYSGVSGTQLAAALARRLKSALKRRVSR